MITEYKPRLTKPEAGNPYYNTISNGGYSSAIQGKPTDPGCTVLSNCFTGDTKIITRDGIVSLKSIAGVNVEVLCYDGIYRPAKCMYFGKQHIVNIKFGNGYSYNTTWNHRWLTYVNAQYNGKQYTKQKFVETKDLTKSHYIPYAKCIIPEDTPLEAIQHGFIYGDGTTYNKRFTEALLCGEKREYMKGFFSDCEHHQRDKRGIEYYYPYPGHYKQIPDVSSSKLEYLRGFIIGLIAADGCVDKYGCISISTTKEQDVFKLYEICSVIGLVCKITTETRDTNYKKNSVLYRILIKKSSISSDMLLNPRHRSRFEYVDSKIQCTHVREITDLLCDADVFCITEPMTHTFTLEGGLVTGNCVGYAFGRFNEISDNTKMSYLQPVNAERFYDVALAQGLKVEQTPMVGSCMVWQKGPTRNPDGRDGAGHVAIVEQVINDTEVITSESGYNCSTPFWTQTRKYGNGNWGQGSEYKFLGFIRNPDVKDSTQTGTTTVVVDPYLVRLDQGTSIFDINGCVVTKKSSISVSTKYTIVEETIIDNTKYGKLKSGAGWVILATVEKPVSATVMRYGDSGVDVLKLQKKLIELGYLYDGGATTKFDRFTLCAVTGYQLEAGLEVDGICGPATQKS